MMRALQVTKFNDFSGLRLGTVADLAPGAGQVRIRVQATSVNNADLLMFRKQYLRPGTKEALPVPFVPGLEAAGIVDSVGAGVRGIAVGDRVMGLCDHGKPGGYAEQAILREEQTLPVPPGFEWKHAGAFMEAFHTAWLLLFAGGALDPDARILLLGGTGGVGTSVLRLANEHKLRPIVAGRFAEKLQRLQGLFSFDPIIVRDGSDLEAQINAVVGPGPCLDVVLDGIGGDVAEAAFLRLAPFGRLVVFGKKADSYPRFLGKYLLGRNASVSGLHLGRLMHERPQEVARCTEALGELLSKSPAALQPLIAQEFPITVLGVQAAWEQHELGQVPGKTVLRWSDGLDGV